MTDTQDINTLEITLNKAKNGIIKVNYNGKDYEFEGLDYGCNPYIIFYFSKDNDNLFFTLFSKELIIKRMEGNPVKFYDIDIPLDEMEIKEFYKNQIEIEDYKVKFL